MNQTVSVGIIGDFAADIPSHQATNEAIKHAAKHLSASVSVSWLPTPAPLTEEGQQRLEQFDGLWAAPGRPYKSLDGALRAIQFARKTGRPFIGT